jgi:hypothetical protein
MYNANTFIYTIKGLVAKFLYICIFYSTYNHSITFIQYIHPSPFAEVHLHLLIAGQLSGKNLLGVPSRESNSGLPYSKPTHYQLSYSTPSLSCAAPLLSYTASLLSYAAPLLSYASPLRSFHATLSYISNPHHFTLL